MPYPDLSPAGLREAQSRRQFLLAGLSLAAALGGCTQLAKVRVGYGLRGTGSPDLLRDVLHHLVRAVLPFEHPHFPAVAPEAVRDRLLAMFPVFDDDFEGFRQGLRLFNEMPLFARATRVLRSDVDTEDRPDESAYAAFRRTHRPGDRPFVAVPLETQRAYVMLWLRSDVTLRRRFAQGAKTLVVVTAYSTEPLWRAIDYDGPLLEAPRAPR